MSQNNGILSLPFFISPPSTFPSETNSSQTECGLLLHLHSESIYIDLICRKSSFTKSLSVAVNKRSSFVFCNGFPCPCRILFATRYQPQITPRTLTSSGISSSHCLLEDSRFRITLIQLSWYFQFLQW